MPSFVGWSPTITGRIAFSRIADDPARNREICNLSDRDDGFIFGVESRTSPDGPLPAWLLRILPGWLIGGPRIPDQFYVLFLDIVPGELPRPNQDPDAKIPVELHLDKRGALCGEIFMFSQSKLAKQSGVHREVAKVRRAAAFARSPLLTDTRRRRLRDEMRTLTRDLFRRLSDECRQGKPTPAFAQGVVHLSRTGRCQIDVEPSGFYGDRAAKLAHRDGLDSDRWKATDFEPRAAFAARHIFNVVRSLAHKHYHHDENADLVATTYPWSLSDDHTWRRETQYGLARMAIEIRRRGSARDFKQCIGVVAYAEAFQIHLCGWRQAADTTLQAAPEVAPYDFDALRSSVEASLKVRELEDAERRQTVLYLTTIFLAALALVVGGVRAIPAPAQGEPTTTTLFGIILDWTTGHPIQTLLIAVFAGWWIDIAALRASLPFPATRQWFFGLSRAVKAGMGSLMWRGWNASWSYASALAGLLTLIGLFGLAAYYFGRVAYRLLSQGLLPS